MSSPKIFPKRPLVPATDAQHAHLWGFRDSAFQVRDGHIFLNSERYSSGGHLLLGFAPFVEKAVGVPFDPSDKNEVKGAKVPEAVSCAALLDALIGALDAERVSQEPDLRLRHGHGHHLEEIFRILYSEISRVPDVVVFPESDAEVQAILTAAKEHKALVIPFGGGTSVSMALACPDLSLPIISLSLERMNRVEWIDPVSKTACIQAGAVGRLLEKDLREHGFTLGHEPDSMEFSTLGGWIATNASGMKKNRYGNIEDIVLDVTVVTVDGVVEHHCAVPRASHGLDVRKWVFGSEGLLGVITRALVKIYRAPEVQFYGSLVFPDWSRGLAFMEELSGLQAVPASVRLVDNLQFQFGRALKPPQDSAFLQKIQKFFVSKVKGIDLEQMVACTLVYEGDRREQEALEKRVQEMARRHGGFSGGGAAGKDGYNLTFGIAYIRDFLLEYWTLGDSFETSVPWGKVDAVIEGVKEAMTRVHRELGLAGHPFVTARVSQIYPTGCCVYFYIGAHYKGCADPILAFTQMEHEARLAIMKAGGALSHHHGIGKTRTRYLGQIKSEAAQKWIQRAQAALDPDGIFASGNQGLTPRS